MNSSAPRQAGLFFADLHRAEVTVDGGPRVRIRLPPAESLRTSGPASGMMRSAPLRRKCAGAGCRAQLLDESQRVGVELLLMGDRQSVGCAGAAIDFVAVTIGLMRRRPRGARLL